MLNISETIRSRRRELGMTQEQLAQMLGVSGPAVSKWEQGISYPDITLLPALARALHTDLNALMSFRRMPEKAEIAQMLAHVNDTAKEKGIEAGLALAQEMAAEYPDCGALLFGLAATIDGRMMLAGMNAQEREAFSAQVGAWYARAAQSEDGETREAAAHLLASYALSRGDIGKAREMMARLPQESKTSRWPLAVSLLLAEGEREKAKSLLQKELFARAGDVQHMLLKLVEMELDEGNPARAEKAADRTQAFVALMDMHPYAGHAARLMPALHKEDARASLAHLRDMIDSLETAWTPGDSLLYDRSGVKKSEHIGKDMLAGIVREIQESEAYAFLREEETFKEMTAACTPDGCPRG